MRFTQMPTDTFKNIGLNAGIICKEFNPSTGVPGDIIAATTSDITFTQTVNFIDFGDDINNCPKNMKELKRIDSIEAKLAATFITVTKASVKSLIVAGDAVEAKIVPRSDLKDEDFQDIWYIGDYSEYNGDSKGGYIAIHLMNALNTGGFQLKAGDKAKMQFPVEYTAHYSNKNPKEVPFEIYVVAGEQEA